MRGKPDSGSHPLWFTEQLHLEAGRRLAVAQCESVYPDRDLIAGILNRSARPFRLARYYYMLVPSYPSGTIGFAYRSKRYSPLEHLDAERVHRLGTMRYYSAEVHRAAFELPAFLARALDGDHGP